MATVICMDGLGGRPDFTFGELGKHLEGEGHRVILLSTEKIETHEDRVSLIMDAARWTEGKVFLIGQSAGAGAVRIAAHRLSNTGVDRIAGVILLSQSMPLFYPYMTSSLLFVMARNLWKIISGKTFLPAEIDYAMVTNPIPPGLIFKTIKSRIPVPGRETRRLAFFPPRLRPYHYPTLAVYGEQDNWISPRAHEKLCESLSEFVPEILVKKIPNSGHLTLVSDRRIEVIHLISNWIESH